jgi:hypothetical protein
MISGIGGLAAACDKYDSDELLAVIAGLVPSYRPSSVLTGESILLEAS